MEVDSVSTSEIKCEFLHSGDVQDCEGKDCSKRAVYKVTRPAAGVLYTHDFYCKSCAQDLDLV